MLSIAGIVVCGLVGGVAAWIIVTSVGLAGVPGAIAAAVTGMLIAMVVWVALTTLWRALAGRR